MRVNEQQWMAGARKLKRMLGNRQNLCQARSQVVQRYAALLRLGSPFSPDVTQYHISHVTSWPA